MDQKERDEPSFADMAVALSLAHCKLGMDLEKSHLGPGFKDGAIVLGLETNTSP